MKPKLKDIKKHFENAKEVRCLFEKDIVILDLESIHQDNNGSEEIKFWAKREYPKNYVKIYDDGKYAEIISYKEETVPVPLRLIKELCKEKNIEEILIREGIIEEDKLELNKWYKWQNSLFFIHGKNKTHYQCYGFDGGEWVDKDEVHIDNDFNIPNESEVFEALKKEINKKYKVGDKIKNHQGEFILEDLDLVYSEKYNNGVWNRQGVGIWLFINGTWAEIIQEETYVKIPLSEIKNNPNDMLLGKLVRNIADNY